MARRVERPDGMHSDFDSARSTDDGALSSRFGRNAPLLASDVETSSGWL